MSELEHSAPLTAVFPRRAGDQRRLFWAHVTAFGALWGVMEITLGSFLHALRLPFAGVIMASLSATLLVAQRQVFSRPGVSIATGMIAALCKSISPGGVILGPMVGITVEALLIELALLFGPRRIASALFAGALAALWALFQTLLWKLIYYGMQLLELYLALLRRAGSWLGLSAEQGWGALFVFLALVAVIGMLGALLGRAIGRAALLEPSDAATPLTLWPVEPRALNDAEHPRSRARRPMLFLAVGAIALQFTGRLELALLSLVVWLTALAIVDGGALRRLWLPRFWGVTLLFALGSGWLLGESDLEWAGVAFSSTGLRAGASMIVRGAFVFALAVWASRAISRRDFERLATRLGLNRIGASLPTALALLPDLELRYRHVRDAARARGLRRLHLFKEMAVALVRETAHLALEMSRTGVTRVFLLGARGAGKSTLIERLEGRLRAESLEVAGIVQPAHERDEAGQAASYDLKCVETGEARPFAQRCADGYTFDDAGWAWARERIVEARRHADVVVVDELGRVEADGEGHVAALLAPLEDERARLWLLGVRRDREGALAAQLGSPALRVVLDEPEEVDVEALAEAIVSLLGERA